MKVDANKKAQRKHYFPTRDHVVPKSVKPGQPILIVCQKCNKDKDNLTLDHWNDKLKYDNDPRQSRIENHLKRIKHD